MTIALRDAAAVAMTSGNTLSATVTGPGYVSWVSGADTPVASQCSVTPQYSGTLGRSITAQTADAVGTLYVCADGASGVSTIAITIADAAGVSQSLSTKTVTFFGAVTKLAATPVFTIGTAGGATTGDATASRHKRGQPSKLEPPTIIRPRGRPNTWFNERPKYRQKKTEIMINTVLC
jgi:hypothetical protein